MTAENLYRKIYRKLRENNDPERLKQDNKFHKDKLTRAFSIKAKRQYKIFNSFKNEIKSLSCREVWQLADHLYSCPEMEKTKLAGNFVLQTRPDCLGVNTLPFLDRELENFYSWSAVDDMVSKVLQPLLFEFPQETLKYLQKWNTSDNKWKRRVSVVAFTRKAGESGRFTQEALDLCSNLIWDREDLVQKGVGWCLKDVMRGDKEQAIEYVKELRWAGVSSVITLYAIRDLKGADRREVLAIRPEK